MERKFVCVDCNNEGITTGIRGRLPKRCTICNKKMNAVRVKDWRLKHEQSKEETTV